MTLPFQAARSSDRTRLAGLLLVRELDHRALRRLGCYVTGPPSPDATRRRIRPLRIPGAARKRTRMSPDGRFVVPLAKVTTPWGFSFHPDGWHPYVATLRHWAEGGYVELPDTPLYELYQRFRPRTVQEAIFEHRREPVEPLRSWPVDAGLLSVWSLTRYRIARAIDRASKAAPRPRQFIGPASDDFVAADLTRLLRLHESIRQHGFVPERFAATPIKGYFLVAGDDYRYVCRQGSHRLAVLSSLGYEAVEVSLAARVVPIVDRADLEWWTVDRGGLYSGALARELFAKMFGETGRTKAEAIGLLPLTRRFSARKGDPLPDAVKDP